MNLFILTGAGVSAESGLGVFRGPGAALWKRYDPMQLATPEAFTAIRRWCARFTMRVGAICSPLRDPRPCRWRGSKPALSSAAAGSLS